VLGSSLFELFSKVVGVISSELRLLWVGHANLELKFVDYQAVAAMIGIINALCKTIDHEYVYGKRRR
jgi:hypothetical protein